MIYRSRAGCVACLLMGAALALTPPRPAAAAPADGAGLPASLQGPLLAVIDAGRTQAEQCPLPEELASLAASHADQAVAIAAFTADRLRTDGATPEDDSRCRCVIGIATALAPVAPQRAADIRGALAERFPECDQPVTGALEHTLSAPAVGPGPGPKLVPPSLPWGTPYTGLSPNPPKPCKKCEAVEAPPPGDASVFRN